MQVVSSQTIRRLEAAGCSSEKNCSFFTLMERAGREAARQIARFRAAKAALRNAPILILAGRGKNGGDGIAAARFLAQFCPDTAIAIYSQTARHELKGDSFFHADLLPERVEFHYFSSIGELPELRCETLIVDALLGIGFTGILREPVKSAAEWINQSNMAVVSLDLPSGIDADTGCGEEAVMADLTITFGFPKSGLYRNLGAEASGMIELADIGLPNPEENEVLFTTFARADARKLLCRKSASLHKNQNGRLLIAAGSPTYPGAAKLSLAGSLAASPGLIFLESRAPRDATPLPPSVILHKWHPDFLATLDAAVAGCGWGSDDAELYLKLEALISSDLPLVLDADALNLLARHPELGKKLSSQDILTPHPGEAAHLAAAFGLPCDLPRQDLAVTLAKKLGCVVVLKGMKTVIANSDGHFSINGSGSVALAKAGSGDVLAGVIGALLAGGLAPFDAAQLAVYLHGLAVEHESGWTSDINHLPEKISKVIQEITPF